MQRLERRHGEVRRAGEDDAQPVGHGDGTAYRRASVDQMTGAFERSRAAGALPRSRRSFSSFLRMRVRLSSER